VPASRKPGADSGNARIRQPGGGRPVVARLQPIWHHYRSSPDTRTREAAMVRTVLLLIALLVLIAIGLIWAGVINLNRNANGSVSIETRDVSVGTAPANVQVPVVKMETRQVSVPNVAVTNGQGNGQ
jgi:hypothetical protein